MELNSLIHSLAAHAQKTPDKACLIEGESGRCVTYGQLWRLARLFARRLGRSGLKSGDHVVVTAQCAIDSFVAQFGVYLAGGVYCPVEAHIRAPRLIELMGYLEASFLVSARPVEYGCQWFDISSLCDDNDENPSDDGAYIWPESTALSAILFTTGTTGKAKGVMLSHLNQAAIAKNTAFINDLNSGDVVLDPLPLSHAGGIRRAHATLYVGGTLVLLESVIFINNFFHSIEQYHVTSVFLAPSFASILTDNASDLLNKYDGKLKKISISTALTTEALKDRLRELLPRTRLFIAFGSTESGNLCSYEFSTHRDKPLCVGTPGAHANILLLDENGEPLEHSSPDNPGIISCRGDNVMMGYWRAPELTRSVLSAGRLIMADLGFWGGDGMLYLVGRRDDVINTGGNKVAPYELEDMAAKIPFVKECACVAVPDKVLGNVIKLLVVAREGMEFSQKTIYSHLLTHLESFKMPRYIEQVDALPKTAELGKLQRYILSER